MSDEFLFDVPTGLVRILDRDLEAAGIPKRDDRGRTLDVHALRTTFGTHLSKAGVPLRTAQAAMRHSTPTLTANIYTDPRLLDVHGAIEALPTLTPLSVPLMSMGGSGIVPVVGNIVPKDMRALIAACNAGDIAKAQQWHHKLFPLCRDLLGLSTDPIPIKAAMQELGRDTGELRLPVTPLADSQRASLRATGGLGRCGIGASDISHAVSCILDVSRNRCKVA